MARLMEKLKILQQWFMRPYLTDALIKYRFLSLQRCCKSLNRILALAKIHLWSLCTFRWSFCKIREMSRENLFTSMVLIKVTASLMLFGGKQIASVRCGKTKLLGKKRTKCNYFNTSTTKTLYIIVNNKYVFMFTHLCVSLITEAITAAF